MSRPADGDGVRGSAPRRELRGEFLSWPLLDTVELLRHDARPDAVFSRAANVAEAWKISARQADPGRRQRTPHHRAAGLGRTACLALRPAHRRAAARAGIALEAGNAASTGARIGRLSRVVGT